MKEEKIELKYEPDKDENGDIDIEEEVKPGEQEDNTVEVIERDEEEDNK